MNIQNKEITRVFNSQNWLLAQRYFHNQYLEDLWIEEYESHYHITARVSLLSHEEIVVIDLNRAGLLVSFHCDCDECKDDQEACAHIGLVLLFIYTLNQVSFPYSWHKHGQTSKPYIEKANTRELKQLFDQYRYLNESSSYIQLIPKVETYPRLAISYKLSTKRSYILKDLQEFIDIYHKQEKLTLGKNVEIYLNSSQFDNYTKKQLAFIEKSLSHQQELSQQRFIYIDETNIDDFFHLYKEDEHIGIQFKTIKETFILKVIKKEELYDIRLENDKDYLISQESIYYLEDQCLYRLDSKQSLRCLYLLNYFKNHSQLLIPNTSMYTFYDSIYEHIKEDVELVGNHLDEFKPKDVDVKLYLDSINEGMSVKVVFDYHDQSFYAYQESEEIGRNHYLEKKIIRSIEKYSSMFDSSIQSFRLTLEDEKVFEFLNHELPSLEPFVSIYASEDLKRMSVPVKPSFKVGVRLKENLLNVNLETIGISKEELKELFYAYQKKKHYYLLKSGQYVDLYDPSLQELKQIVDTLHVSDQLDKEDMELSLPYSFYLQQLSFTNSNIDLDASVYDYIYQVEEPSDFSIPKSLENKLRNYQKDGYLWLKSHMHYRIGAILADDMGLGKTIQMLALLEEQRLKQPDMKCFIVCPSSLILNWQDEIHKFTPELDYVCIMGNAKQREMLIQEKHQLYITSYDYLRNDLPLYRDTLFDVMILDEAQYIKNQGTKSARSAKLIQAKQRFALTGTPIENSLAELWSIFDFLIPGYLGTYRHFRDYYEYPILRFEDEEALALLKKKIEPFILRRMKKEVLLELPDKIETTLTIPFNEKEKKFYYTSLAYINQELKDYLQANDTLQDKISILAHLTRLRELCLDPRLIDDTFDTLSSKLESCLQLIEMARSNHQKVLVFSSFKKALELLESSLKEKEIDYYKIYGETKKMERYEQIDKFHKDDTSVFLISLKAGGTGVNLTAANIVIHLDPWWNVSAMNQATDRAYRIGQLQNVHVYKLVMEDSIEEKIMKLQSRKEALSQALIEPTDLSLSSITKDELLSLFEE